MTDWYFNSASPHYLFWVHIKNGERVWRDDKLNHVQEWLDLTSLNGDANSIKKYGYQDLSIRAEESYENT